MTTPDLSVTFTVLDPSDRRTAATAVLRQAGATPRPADPSRYDLDAASAAIEAIVSRLAELGAPSRSADSPIRRAICRDGRASASHLEDVPPG